MGTVQIVIAATALMAVVALLLWRLGRNRDAFGTQQDRIAFHTLHQATLAGTPLRAGLTTSSAEKAVRHLRGMLGAQAVAINDLAECLSWDGAGDHHRESAAEAATAVAEGGATSVSRLSCDRAGCALKHVVTAPLTVDNRVVGSLQVLAPTASAGLIRATNEVAGWVSGQLGLAEVEESRTRVVEAEVRALRAQISPHFVYNSLTAIASFVRTDPERARDLLVEFADFTRYSFRRHGDFTTLAEELRSIERYLVLEQARFGDRLQVTLRVAPEALAVSLPFLSIQPLVENAVRHGLEGKPDRGHITIVAEDSGTDVVIWVEDDGVGEDPERVRRALAGDASADSIGLGNVDERLRAAFGDAYGLVIETQVGAGTKATVRAPKFAPGLSR